MQEEVQEEVQDAAAHPFVEEGHKAIAFRLPRRHVLDHAGVSVDGQQHVVKELQSHLRWRRVRSVKRDSRYPAEGAKGGFDVFCGDFWAQVSNKHMEVT